MTRWARVAEAVALIVGSLLFCALCIEVSLRLVPEMLGVKMANQLFSAYTRRPGGMYFEEDSTGMFFMHPSHRIRAYFNGYAWDHETDARGFRNPPGRPVDGTLLLGDSLIYGHGVDEAESVAGHLEARYGVPVYNLSRQGDCLYQHYVLLRLHLEAFAPERVVLFVFQNDFDDLMQNRGLALLTSAPEIARADYATLREAIAVAEPDPHPWSRSIRYRSLTYRLILALRSRIRHLPAGTAASGRSDVAIDPIAAPLLDDAMLPVLRDYYDRILGDLAVRADAVGAELDVVYLDAYPTTTPATREAERRARELVFGAASRHGIATFDTGDLLAGCDACILPGDGHLTAEGNARLARFLHEALAL